MRARKLKLSHVQRLKRAKVKFAPAFAVAFSCSTPVEAAKMMKEIAKDTESSQQKKEDAFIRHSP
jgi:hypothetical protein